MNLQPSDDDAMIEAMAERYLREWFARREGGTILGHDPALWAGFAEMGWLAMPLDEARGGIGAAASTLAVLVQALGRERANEPYVATVIRGLGLLTALDGSSQVDALIDAVATGTARVAVVDAVIAGTRDGDGLRLTGEAPLVIGADRDTILLVPVETPDGLALHAVPAADRLTPVATIDGSTAADVNFAGVLLTDSPLSAEHDLTALLDRNLDRAAAFACADALGAMEALLERTSAYSRTRQQFGKPLRSFQVVDHAIADMQTCVEEARAATVLAIGKIDAPAEQRTRAIAAARVKIGDGSRRLAHIAIQLHGAMGVTDELDVGAYVKRLIAFDVTWRTRPDHLARYADLARAGGASDCLAGPGETGVAPDFGLAPDAQAFAAETDALFDRTLPPAVARAQRLTTMVYAETDDAAAWHRIAHENGVAAPNWPAGDGGAGWTEEQRYVWAHRSAGRFVPVISPIGLQLVGPVLRHFGTDAQKQRYLPRIADGSEIWCQGFSEPGAGSDLAALATRAVRDGDDYVISGTKIWTTQGHSAQFMAALVRTGAAGGRRDGISFVIVDMRSPGVKVRPILTIGGDHEVNQIFLDDVRIPAANLVGPENDGWAIAKFLLEYERGGDIMSAGHRALLNDIREIALDRGERSERFWTAFAAASIDVDVLEVMELRSLFGIANRAVAPSVLKLRASEVQQTVTELGADLLGADLIRWQAARPLHAVPGIRPQDALASRYLNSRATTIFGGAREIQKTLIARAVA